MVVQTCIPRCISNTHWFLYLLCPKDCEILVFDSFPLEGSRKIIEEDVGNIVSYLQYIAETGGEEFNAASMKVKFVQVPKQGDTSNDCAIHTVVNMARIALKNDLPNINIKSTDDSRKFRNAISGCMKSASCIKTTAARIEFSGIHGTRETIDIDVEEIQPIERPKTLSLVKNNHPVWDGIYLTFPTSVQYTFVEASSSTNNLVGNNSTSQSKIQNSQKNSISNKIKAIGCSLSKKPNCIHNLLDKHASYEIFIGKVRCTMLASMVQCIFDFWNNEFIWKTYLVNIMEHTPASPPLQILQLDDSTNFFVLIPVYVNLQCSLLILYNNGSSEEKIFSLGCQLTIETIKNCVRQIENFKQYWGDKENSAIFPNITHLSIANDKIGLCSIFYLLNYFFQIKREILSERDGFVSYDEYRTSLRQQCQKLTMTTNIAMQLEYDKFRRQYLK